MNKLLKQLTSTLENGGGSHKKTTVPSYWCGGAKGAENEWNEVLNWYNRRIPGWFDKVVISNKYTHNGFFPIIYEFVNDVSQVIIENGGRLVIGQTGRLSVDGLSREPIGIVNFGEIFIEGELTIQRTTTACIENHGYILNSGSLAIDKTEQRGILKLEKGRLENLGELLFI